MYAYSEITFGVPTMGYVMTENGIYPFFDVSDSHSGHTDKKNSSQKTVQRNMHVNMSSKS